MEITRRELLKAVLPLGWISEVRKAGGIGKLSTSSKISLLKDIAIFIPGAAAILIQRRTPERTDKTSFKEKVKSFTWEQAASRAELEKFIETLADEYLELTKTNRVKKEDLISKAKLNFYPNREEFIRAIREIAPEFSPTLQQFGFTHYESKRIFIDLGMLKQSSMEQGKLGGIGPEKTAGLALLDALWHEWGHLDVTERTHGNFINNPELYFYSPKTNRNEQFKRYRGAAVFTDTYFGFLRFEEVLNETITVRRMIQQVGLEEIISAGDYYQNGIDFFPLFTSAVGISLDTLYQMHATSDFEGLTILIGQHLPGDGDAFEKGSKLLVGIHRSDPLRIQQTGVFNLIPQRR